MSRPTSFDVSFPLVGFNPSGGVRMLIHAANELAARGRRVVFSVPPHACAPPIPLHPGVEVATRASGSGFGARRSFVAELPPARVQVASGYQTPLLIALGLTRAGMRSRIVYLVQNDEVTSHVRYGSASPLIKPVLATIARAGFRVPARRIAVSTFVAERVGEGRIHRVIPPGIEPSFLRSLAPRAAGNRTRVGILAHPAPVKGMAVALSALECLRDARIQPIVFDGANPAPVPEWADRFSVIASASSGVAPDIDGFYALCDVFVFPSYVEGFGLPPLEAMARGAATVISDCGGVSEYARHERNCLLFAPGDAVAAADAVRRLIDDMPLRADIVAEGRATALRFSVERFASECAGEIEGMLDKG